MLINTAIIVAMQENGEITSVYMNSKESFWVSKVGEYKSQESIGPVYFHDETHRDEYNNKSTVKLLGESQFRKDKNMCFFSHEWEIPSAESCGETFLAISLPMHSVIDMKSIKILDHKNYSNDEELQRDIKLDTNGNCFVIYAKSSPTKRAIHFSVKFSFEINKELFNKVKDKYKERISNEDDLWKTYLLENDIYKIKQIEDALFNPSLSFPSTAKPTVQPQATDSHTRVDKFYSQQIAEYNVYYQATPSEREQKQLQDLIVKPTSNEQHFTQQGASSMSAPRTLDPSLNPLDNNNQKSAASSSSIATQPSSVAEQGIESSSNNGILSKPKSFADLDGIIKLWAEKWAKERGSEVSWIAYSDQQLNKNLKEKSGSNGKKPSKVFKTGHQLIIDLLNNPVSRDSKVAGEEEICEYDDRYKGISNPLHQHTQLSISLKNSYVSGSKLTDSTTKSFKALSLLEVSLPAISKLQVTLEAALNISKANEHSSGIANETSLPFPIMLPPDSRSDIQVKRTKVPVIRTVTVKVAVSGAVVVCCEKKVRLISQSKKKLKWVIPLEQIIADIKRFQLNYQGFDLEQNDKIVFLQQETATSIKSVETEAKIIHTEPLSQDFSSLPSTTSQRAAESMASLPQKNTHEKPALPTYGKKIKMTGIKGTPANSADISMALVSQANITIPEGASPADIEQITALTRTQDASAITILNNIDEIEMIGVDTDEAISNLNLKQDVIRGGNHTLQPRFFPSAGKSTNAQAIGSSTSTATSMNNEKAATPILHKEKEEASASPSMGS